MSTKSIEPRTTLIRLEAKLDALLRVAALDPEVFAEVGKFKLVPGPLPRSRG